MSAIDITEACSRIPLSKNTHSELSKATRILHEVANLLVAGSICASTAWLFQIQADYVLVVSGKIETSLDGLVCIAQSCALVTCLHNFQTACFASVSNRSESTRTDWVQDLCN